MNNLETELGVDSNLELELAAAVEDVPLWRGMGLIAAWEAQSQLATLVMVALVAMVSFWLAFGIMLGWSLVATVVYYHARKRGLPDLLDDRQSGKARLRRGLSGSMAGAVASAVKVWLVGLQAFLYAKTFCRVLSSPAVSWRRRLARSTVLGVGLTLYGVTTCHHILRRAGYSDAGVLRMSMVGSVLNVSYRVLLGAIVVDALSTAIRFA